MPLKTKTVRQPKFPVAAYAYRIPLPVKEVLVFADGARYPICPRCDTSVDRAFMNYCDRCGQHLSWTFFELAAAVPAPRRKSE